MKKLSTILLASTMAITMVMPVAAQGAETLTKQKEEIVLDAAKEVKKEDTKKDGKEDKEEIKDKDKEEVKDTDKEDKDKEKEDKEEVKDTDKKEDKKNKELHEAYLKGYEDKTVKPNGKITREEVAAIVHRLAGDERPTTMMLVAYKDLDRDRWSYNDINILVNQNILKGYPDGTFKPGEPITRAEAAAIFARFTKTAPALEVTNADYKGHWAEKEILTGVTKGYIKGYEDGTFKPDKDITRAEFVKMANMVFDRCGDVDLSKIDEKALPKDLDKDEWYFKDMVEAIVPHTFKVEDGKNIFNESLIQPREDKKDDKEEVKDNDKKEEVKETEKTEDKKDKEEVKDIDKKEDKEEKDNKDKENKEEKDNKKEEK